MEATIKIILLVSIFIFAILLAILSLRLWHTRHTAIQDLKDYVMGYDKTSYVERQMQAFKKLGLKPNCFVDFERGEAWARMDLNSDKIVRCDVDRKRGKVQSRRRGLSGTSYIH